MTAVAARGLFRRYGRRFALLDVSFEVAEGACVMLAGRNGSGKSTLLRVFSTLLRPDHGQLRLFGRDPRQEADEVRRRTALLGHRTFLYEPLTALENLELWARLLGKDASRSALADRLSEVGLAERAHDPVAGFSAGMRQRLALARVLLKDAELVLLDEPYGHLDPPGFRLVDGLLETPPRPRPHRPPGHPPPGPRSRALRPGPASRGGPPGLRRPVVGDARRGRGRLQLGRRRGLSSR